MGTPVTQRFDVTIKQRTSINRIIAVLYDPDTSQLFDLTGYTAQAQVRPSAGHASYLLDLSDKISGDANGNVTLELTPADTANTIRRGVWDVILTSADETVAFVAVQGTFAILPTVTVPPTPAP